MDPMLYLLLVWKAPNSVQHLFIREFNFVYDSFLNLSIKNKRNGAGDSSVIKSRAHCSSRETRVQVPAFTGGSSPPPGTAPPGSNTLFQPPAPALTCTNPQTNKSTYFKNKYLKKYSPRKAIGILRLHCVFWLFKNIPNPLYVSN